MSDQEQQGGRARYDRKAKNGSASSGPSTTGTSRSSRGKKKLSPLQPVQNRFSGQKKVDLPVDVWLMIAEHAHPYSLLQLSRTNKSFRRIFTSKELSSAIWNRALQNLEGFPNFQTTDFGEPRLVAFMYEDICAVCKKGETDRESYSMRIRLHTEGCGDKLIMQGRKMLLKIPAIREEVFLCIPKAFNWYGSSWDVKSWDVESRQYGCEFVTDEARKVNLDLHDHLSSSDPRDEAVAISSFIQEHQPRVESMEKDGADLSVWIDTNSPFERRRFSNALSYHCRVTSRAASQWMRVAIGQDWETEIRVSLLSAEGWSQLYYEIEKLFLSEYYDSFKKAQRQQQSKRRKLLSAQFNTLKDDDPFYPPFSIFTELPSVRKFWEPLNASNAPIEEEWDERQIQALEPDILAAKSWTQISLARLLSQSLAQLWKPLSPDLYSSLHPEDYLLPPPFFDGIHDSLNSTGVFLDDPASISATELEELLDRFSNQAWFFDSQQPRTLAVTLRDNLDRISKIDYRGPLFPSFHKFWHQILSQVLEKSGIEDGPQGEVTQKLEDLGSCFSCGACGVDGEETGLMTAIELLKHFKDHGFPAEGTPQDSLIVYHSLEAEGNDEGLKASTENTL